MSSQLEPHIALTITRPDEVAECYDGVLAVEGLYEALWDLVSSYTGPSPEEAEEPTYGLDCVAVFWDRLSDEHKAAVNRLAEENTVWNV